MAEKIRVLYVDDESALLELCKMFLERSGDFTVTIATSAPEAIRILGQERFDTIVSDYQMPEMDGIEFLNHLKAEGNTTPFIIFTGKGREEVVIEALNAGVDGYLQKGGESKSQFAELAHKIKKAVGGKHAEEAFKDSEERYRTLFHKMLNGFAVHEILCDAAGKPYDYRFLDINPAFEEMTGIARERVIGKTILQVLPKTEPIWIERYGKVALTGEPDYFVEHSEEFGKFFEVTVYQNAPHQFTTIFSDVTERKQADVALQKSEEKYRHLIEHSYEAIVVAQDGILKLVNHRTIEFTGYSEQELLSMPFSAFIHPDDRAMVVERYQKRLKGEKLPSRYAFRLSPKDGSTRWVEIGVVAIDWEGHPATLNFLTDITERKQAEEQLKQTVDELKRFNNLTVDREQRMIELKKEINALQKNAGKPEKYRNGA